MKKSLIISLCLVTALFGVVPVFSVSDESTESATVTPKKAVDDEVDKLKEKVAEKVLGMKGNKDKVASGVIQTIEAKSIVIENTDGKKVEIALDDTLTKYYSIAGTTTKDSKKDSLKKGDYIFAVGPEINGSINANGIYADQRYMVVSGKITEVNSDDFSLKIVTLDKNNYVLDVQTRTTSEMFNIKTQETEKIGFSKLKEGDSIHVVMKANLANKNQTRYDAEKMLIIPNEYFLQ